MYDEGFLAHVQSNHRLSADRSEFRIGIAEPMAVSSIDLRRIVGLDGVLTEELKATVQARLLRETCTVDWKSPANGESAPVFLRLLHHLLTLYFEHWLALRSSNFALYVASLKRFAPFVFLFGSRQYQLLFLDTFGALNSLPADVRQLLDAGGLSVVFSKQSLNDLAADEALESTINLDAKTVLRDIKAESVPKVRFGRLSPSCVSRCLVHR